MQEHSARLLKEKSSDRLHSTIDIPSHLQLLTAADLSLRTAVCTTCSRSCSKYRMRKCFNGEIFVVEQYSSTKLSNNECRPKIFSLRKKANYGSEFH